MRFFLFTFILCTSFAANPSVAHSIVFETYASECVRECQHILTLDKLRQEMCFKSWDQKKQPRCIEHKWKNKNDFQILINSVPESFFSLPETVGSPDAFDQGGIKLFILKDGKNNKSDIDPSEVPKFMNTFIKKLRDLASEFN